MDEKLKNVDLIDELQMTFEDVHDQLVEDEKRWGSNCCHKIYENL